MAAEDGELHPNLITQWRRQALEKLARVFDDEGLQRFWIGSHAEYNRLVR